MATSCCPREATDGASGVTKATGDQPKPITPREAVATVFRHEPFACLFEGTPLIRGPAAAPVTPLARRAADFQQLAQHAESIAHQRHLRLLAIVPFDRHLDDARRCSRATISTSRSNAQPSTFTIGKMDATAAAVNILKPHCESSIPGRTIGNNKGGVRLTELPVLGLARRPRRHRPVMASPRAFVGESHLPGPLRALSRSATTCATRSFACQAVTEGDLAELPLRVRHSKKPKSRHPTI
jgi:hypothetical protein